MAELMSRSGLFSSRHHRVAGECGVSVFPRSFKAGKLAGFQLRLRPVAMTKPPGLRSPVSRSRSSVFGDGIVHKRPECVPKRRLSRNYSSNVQGNLRIGKAQKWWEKGLQPNMREVNGAQDLVESLLSAGDKLVVVGFFSPGCGGCRALHPKICQLAEMNPDVQFLQVNYEEHKSMCYSLNVHVLPFFRLYRGAHGRLCSFSCTNATIKKFKDALAKHIPDRCSLGPTKGLEEKELLALAANKDLSFNYKPKPVPVTEHEEAVAEPVVSPAHSDLPLPVSLPLPHQPLRTKNLWLIQQDEVGNYSISSSSLLFFLYRHFSIFLGLFLSLQCLQSKKLVKTIHRT
ncbi:thioredoxin-like 1-1, chloroplastic [Eucalyptus grandis]|uniref:thioredoxin-like 1-1, chloroplastic n=1 Tax=Eucalyptus grandis TaxID=71139 RepID=UPI00192EC29A|nr:thioredoxin-like 1-1, chloroplastic [Eucalyptus grandis]